VKYRIRDGRKCSCRSPTFVIIYRSFYSIVKENKITVPFLYIELRRKTFVIEINASTWAVY
jgi:hypothetical protein